MQWDVATVSVIVSGCVALGTIVIPPILNFIFNLMESGKSRKDVELGKIDQATEALLSALVLYRAMLVYSGTQPEKLADLLGKCYAWEQTVWPHFKQIDPDRLTKLRHDFEQVTKQNVGTQSSRLANEVYELTRLAIKAVG